MGYYMKGTLHVGADIYENSYIVCTDIKKGVVDDFYSFLMTAYSDPEFTNSIVTCDYLLFDVPSDESEAALNYGALSCAKAAYMPDGEAHSD